MFWAQICQLYGTMANCLPIHAGGVLCLALCLSDLLAYDHSGVTLHSPPSAQGIGSQRSCALMHPHILQRVALKDQLHNVDGCCEECPFAAGCLFPMVVPWPS